MDFVLQYCQLTNGGQQSLALAMVLAGLITGFTHCAAMCGPFVLAQLPVGNVPSAEPMLQRLKGAVLLPYHLGRTTTYVGLGALSGGLSGAFLGGETQKNVSVFLLLTAGFIFLINALPAFKSKFFVRLPFAYEAGLLVGRLAKPFMGQQSGGRQYFLGLFLGFLPCGMVMSALMAAASTGDALAGAVLMAAFGFGTVPALVLTGAGGRLAALRWPGKMQAVTRGIMAFNGLLLVLVAGSIIL